MSLKSVKGVFLASAVYDILVGLVIGLLFKPVYNTFGVALPNHAGYVQLSALYVLIFGVGFWFVYTDPVAHAGIIRLGILMKASFALVVFGHLLIDTVPGFYVPFAAADIVFLVLFIMADRAVRGSAPQLAKP